MPAAFRCIVTIRPSSRERIYLDKTHPNLLHDEITTIDHALTRPWVVMETDPPSGCDR